MSLQWIMIVSLALAVHSSGAIRPATTSDSLLRCGSVLCQVISELFSKAKLDYGYNYVATIPAGAMNVSIKQMSRSDNWLVLKTTEDSYIINGNKRASESGIFEYNDDAFDYNKEAGTITTKGPLSKPVILMLFVRGLNTGIKYDYTIPVPSASLSEEESLQTQWNESGEPLDDASSGNNVEGGRVRERKRRKFSWKLLGFGQCNRSCGPGVQPPIFRCIRESTTRFYSAKRCAALEKPVFNEDIYRCNRGLCPAYWRAGDYGECRCPDENEKEGVRKRYIKCVQEQISGKVEEVKENLCEQDKLPDLEETCHCAPRSSGRRKIYSRAPDSRPARMYSRLMIAPATVRNIRNISAPARRYHQANSTDKSGVWLMSPWHAKECASVGCSISFEYRSIYCERTTPNTEVCDLRFTPEQKRLCTNRSNDDRQLECQKGIWFTTEWSDCSGDCFVLQRRRTVLCLKDGIVVEDGECRADTKPKEEIACTHKDVDHCGTKWHYSEWSECSRSCGEGVRRRYAKCLDYDWKLNALIESNQCKYLDREPVYTPCNIQKCPGRDLSSLNDLLGSDDALDDYAASSEDNNNNNNNNKKDDITADNDYYDESDTADDCSDQIKNCERIHRQRLCNLQYYKISCCATCRGH